MDIFKTENIMKSKNVFSSRSIIWSLMDQKVGDWFLEQGVKGEKGKLSRKTLAQYLHKLSKPPPPWSSKKRKRKSISENACSKFAEIEQKFPPPTAIQQYKLQLKLHNAVPNIDVPIGVD